MYLYQFILLTFFLDFFQKKRNLIILKIILTDLIF